MWKTVSHEVLLVSGCSLGRNSRILSVGSSLHSLGRSNNPQRDLHRGHCKTLPKLLSGDICKQQLVGAPSSGAQTDNAEQCYISVCPSPRTINHKTCGRRRKINNPHSIANSTVSDLNMQLIQTQIHSPKLTFLGHLLNPQKVYSLGLYTYNNEISIVLQSQRRFFTRSAHLQKKVVDDDEQSDLDLDDDSSEDPLLTDQGYKEAFFDQYLLPSSGHSVFVLQPDFKGPNMKKHLTTAMLQLDEASALVETLPGWKVIDKAIYSLKHIHPKTLYGKGNFAEIRQHIRQSKGVTAAFVSVNMLTAAQLGTLQQAWGIPVYDRYTVVLQIFKTRAQTKEAKLQVALAEIPYFRSRIKGMHEGTLDQQRGGLTHVGGSGETFLEIRHRLLQERETMLKKALAKVATKRQLLKRMRQKREMPTVAVVGYTNAGKTSLIKALTQDQSMQPQDQLFATLDVTVHAGQLDNHMTVLYVDTVGFISDIPTDLIASFTATLEDMLQADVIVHVYDVSHPDQAAQKQNVLETLQALNLPDSLRNNIVEVGNKADLLKDDPDMTENRIYISAVTGQGLAQLREKVKDTAMAATGRMRKRFKIPMSGPHLSWLYKEATVEATHDAEDNTEKLLVDVIMTEAQYAKYMARFGKTKRKEH